MGFTAAALAAGINEASKPEATNTASAMIAVWNSTSGVPKNPALPPLASSIFAIDPINSAPTTRPLYPATAVMNSDSCMIIATIEAGVAPSALRRPISRVLSFTTISMMLPTPTAPAKIVPMATSQLKNLMPVNRPCTLSYSFLEVEAAEDAPVVGAHLVDLARGRP